MPYIPEVRCSYESFSCHSPTPGTWGLLWLLCPIMLSLSLLIGKITPDARGWSIYYQLACVTREGHGCCLLLFVCLRNKASFDTDSSQLICSLNTATLGGVCAQFCSSSVFTSVCMNSCLCVCARVCRAHWLRVSGSWQWVHTGTWIEKWSWVVTPRQLVVKGHLSISALI